ncbi:MAG: oligopeptide transporter, OPT family [Prevotellaceae bacterium]|jgi:putative OPT family oligopeptide transporter|nr:oligopeptide transporter, OPT family [Prevotellaceae bacterium]
MENNEEKIIGLPDNAFTELKHDEEYKPIMSANKKYPEANTWSVLWGILMAALFSAAAAYLGLKVGQVFEAAIPIAIIAVGLSTVAKRKNALGENVIIQSIGSSSGVIVAGAIFTLPAIYILQAKYGDEMSVSFIQILMSSLLGGILGILFLIPFRKYFVKDMHGKYPFPEATATTQVLVSGEKGGSQAKPLIIAGIVGGLYDFVIATFGVWTETFRSTVCAWGQEIADKTKLFFGINTCAAVLGLGYIVGLRYAAIICFGSFLVWFVIIPLLPLLSDSILTFLNATYAGGIDAMSPETIFKGMEPKPGVVTFSGFARHIGIGGIATAGIIGIIKSWKIIKGAIGMVSNEMKNKSANADKEIVRTQRDLPMKIVAFGLIFTLLVVFAFFFFGVMDFNLLYAVIGILVVGIIAFLFTTVAANAIAIVGTNPVSGMTLMTLILSSVIMVAVGLKGATGIVSSLIMGGVVCTALSMAGGFVTDLKIGYWLGSTPATQQRWKFLGTLVAAVTVGGVMIILNDVYGFVGKGALVAPQANAMAAVIDPLMSGTGAPWLLYAIGAVIALVLNFCKVPALAFALGMFIPLTLNVPLLIGGAISWFVTTRSKKSEVNKERGEKGTLLASGFIAGGALMGVLSAALRFGNIDLTLENWVKSQGAEILSIVMYGALIGFLLWQILKNKKSKIND